MQISAFRKILGLASGHFFPARQSQTQSQRLEALGQLAGGVAHDFNNILSIIDGYARIAKREVADNETAVDYLDRIMASVKRGSGLTNRLLTFGRHSVITESVTEMGNFIRDQKIFLGPLLDASIDLSISAEEDLYVDCSPDTLGQILINLVINARDAMPQGGKIEVECKKVNHKSLKMCCYLGVKDNGYGMDEKTRQKIFDPFFTTKDQGKGTGLGLSMIYGLVKQAKGRIDVCSRIGEGTEISIYFPMSQKRPLKNFVQAYDETGTAQLKGCTILVAEDEPDLLSLIEGMLREMGMDVLTAHHGNEALLKQDEYNGPIDFLLTDVVMPELNGVKLADLFREIRPETKILFMSGYPANAHMTRVEVPQESVLMAKPVEYGKLSYILGKMALSALDQNNHQIGNIWVQPQMSEKGR